VAATLYSLPVSHPALAARCMLEHKGIEHRVVELVPGLQPEALRLLRFRGGTVPALEIGGRRVQGSREISRALDELQPEPPLFPRDPEAQLFARASGADEAAVRADLAALDAHLAEVERLRDAAVLGAPERNAADFQIASSLRSLAELGDLAPYVADRPAMRWAATVVPPLPGPVPSVLPRAWLRPLEAAPA
jgi:hypothetical protein